MKFDIRFKGIDYSRSLADYVQDKFEKLDKFEIKPTTVHVTFRTERHMKLAEVYIQGLHVPFRARGTGDTYLDCVDSVLKKLSKQMSKEKSKVKRHKNYDRTNVAMLEERIREDRQHYLTRHRKAA